MIAIAALHNGEPVIDLQLVALERTLRRQLLEFEALPDYKNIVERNFEIFIAQHHYNANLMLFLRAMQNVFLQKRRTETADLYEEPFDRFGEDKGKELIDFTERFAA
jgi:type I restriction enzyme, R subunit